MLQFWSILNERVDLYQGVAILWVVDRDGFYDPLARRVEDSNDCLVRRDYNPAERAREKQASRDQDAADLASGRKTREQLKRENSATAGIQFHMNLAAAKKLS